jgi:mono/diheme cytochrome c family protein
MKKFVRYFIFSVLGFLVIVGALLSYIKLALPNIADAAPLKVEITPGKIERGKYLANAVCVCMDCHSTRDWSKFSGPLKEGTFGKGGERFGKEFGFPGEYFSRNITPAGIGDYTDGELMRVITTGVDKHGNAMFPVMPFPYYSKMDPKDIECIIAYLRSLKPVPSENKPSTSDFPFNFIINTIPKEAEPQAIPPIGKNIAYGAYLINAAGCAECHTPVKNGQIITELIYSGGREFPFPDGSVVRSANLTPDESGIGNWTEEAFIKRFKMYADSSYVIPNVKPGEFNTAMPWVMYAQMKEEDLAAIYVYLKTLKPVKNRIEKFSGAKK